MFQTTNKFDKTIKVAIKVLDKIKIDDMECIINEVKILNKLDHPNICKYFETYDDKQYIYLVMEYVEGTDLYSKITK